MSKHLDKSTPRGPAARRGDRLPRSLAFLVTAMTVLGLSLAAGSASAAPEAHILRLDPRAAKVDDAPILTSVIEVVQNKRMSELTAPCAAMNGDSYYDCVAEALEKPGALYSSFDFPDKNAFFTVKVDGQDFPLNFESKIRWGDAAAQNQPGVGTAWLILIDAAGTMGPRFDEAKAVAAAFVNAMGPQDIVDIMFFNDKAVVLDSKWTASKQTAAGFLNNAAGTYPVQGRTRTLSKIVRTAVTDGFNELGNAGVNVKEPMHQALVVLSNGAAGTDPETSSPGASILRQYITKGRFPEDNTARPKMPVPVISIWFPAKAMEEFAQNAREFMEGLANPEIGGFFSIMRDRQAHRAPGIVSSVRTRFNKMHIVKWRAACIAPTVTQTFGLAFVNTNPPIAGDNIFQDVPVGIDPTTWPLDLDRDATERYAKTKEPMYPGGKVRVYGNFCWGGNAQRAELYMVPKNQPAPTTLQGGSLEDIRKAQRNLIESGMRGKAISASDTFVEFEIPDKESWLMGKGDAMTGRLIVYDNGAKRASPITQDKILTLKAKAAPPPYLLIGGGVFGGVVLVLLLVSIFKGGGKRGRQAAVAAPRPVVAGGAPAPAPFAPAPAPFAPSPMGGPMGGGPMGGPGPDMGFGGNAFGGPPPGGASRAVLTGGAGIFTVQMGSEMRAGRDGAVCQILLSEPRVSGTHATLKIEGGQLLVRDENSNNGTFVNGQRIPAMVWTSVPPGAALRFGPAEFSVRLE